MTADNDEESGPEPVRLEPDGDTGTSRPRSVPPATTFGWHGWVLVAVLILSLLVVPAAILLLPAAQGFIRSLGLTLRDAYLTLPLVPAFALGATAVWAALRSRER